MKTVLDKVKRKVGKAIGDFNLIEDGDRILVALSGGKDSWTLLYALLELQRRAPVRYELAAVTILPDHGMGATDLLQERLSHDGIAHQVVEGAILEVVKENLTQGTNPCSFCARLRRGILYTHAARGAWNKIALGHHLDDFIETLLLNLFFSGTIKAMSPNLEADDGLNRVIRPLAYVKEAMTAECASELDVPIIGCLCPFTGNSSPRRHWVKSLIGRIEQEVPEVRSNLMSALGRVDHRHLLTAWAGHGGSERLRDDEPEHCV